MPFDPSLTLDPTSGDGESADDGKPLDPRPALCLSGGGYRAMIFHVGALWRLNELGWLPRLGRVSSVSGGSIAAGVLALAWRELAFDPATGVSAAFDARVVQPLRKMASTGVDVGAVLTGALLPFVTISDRVASAYRAHLFGKAKLADLPSDGEGPRFVFNTTSLQTGALFRFSRPYAADYHLGQLLEPDVGLAEVVAASSAFPPILSPAEVELRGKRWDPEQPPAGLDGYRGTAQLTDGGVYDNLGLETVWKRHRVVLVSDGGGAMDSDQHPATDWARHTVRVLNIIDNQVRSLRKRILVDGFKAKLREGAYWGIRVDQARYPVKSAIAVPFDRSLKLANEPTRLARMDPQVQERLINWGYAVCDAAMRSHVIEPAAFAKVKGATLPYPDAGV